MPKDQIYDQSLKDHVKILHTFVAGYHDRFFILFITKTLIDGEPSGRLFYFHLNENAPFLDHNFLHLNDLESMLYYLKLEDPNMSWNDCAQWMKKIKNQCLFVKVNRIFGQVSPTFKVDVKLYRMDFLFQNDRSLETVWRKLTVITPDHLNLREIAQFYMSLSETMKISQFYKSVSEAFIQNSDRNLDDPNFRVKFRLTKENFLHFFYGALLFHVRAFYPAKITPIHNGRSLDKLALLILDEEKWVTHLEPVLFKVYESAEEKFESSGLENEIYDLPVDFATNSLRALVSSLTLRPENSGRDFDVATKMINIAKVNHLLNYLEKMVDLDPDYFYQNLNRWRNDLILQLNRIDTFLGYDSKRMTGLKHFLFGSLMALDGGNLAFKLNKSKIKKDIFLIKSRENGIVISFSPEVMHETKSDAISDLILSTNLKKFLVLSITDRPFSHDILDDGTFSPFLGMLNNEITIDSTSSIDSSTWNLIRTHFTGNFFTEMLINHKKQVSRSAAWKSEMEFHSMLPKFHSEFRAQVKGIVSTGKQVFTPYATTLLGFTVEKYVQEQRNFKVPLLVGDSKDTFHIILHLTPYETIDQDDPIKTMKQYFKGALLSSKYGKVNSALIRVALSNNEDGYLRFNYFASYPNGKNRDEYKLCNERSKRSGQKCLSLEEEEEKKPPVEGEESVHSKIPRIINTAMYFQMVKGVVGSIIDGDYGRMGKEVGILAATVTLSFIGDKSLHWGQNLLKIGQLIKGGSAYVGGALLSKAYLGFIAQDLVSRIKTFKLDGDKDQIVGIVGDTVLLSINALSTGLELYSTFASIEEASVELGPQVMIAEAVIFAIIDGFYATRSVQKIHEEIRLSWGEKVTQWFRSFFGAHPSQYIELLMQEKVLLQKTVDDMVHKFSMPGNTIRYYATPTLYVNQEKLAVRRENNVINMNKKVTMKSRVWPEPKENFKIECAANKQPATISRSRNLTNKIGFTSDGTFHESIFCKNMISISLMGNLSYSLESDLALIELGSGDDAATGFQNMRNYFILNSGKKRIVGGKFADTFLLISNNSHIFGKIDGAGGDNILDTSKYLLLESLLYDLGNELLIHSNNISTTIKGMEHIIGRKKSNDRVICGCRTKFLDLKGGKSIKNPDQILIPNLNCIKNITIKLSGYIQVENFVNESTRIFFLVQNKSTSSVSSASNFSTMIFFLPMKITDLDSIEREKNRIRIECKKHKIKLVIKNQTEKCIFIFADKFRVVYQNGYFHAELYQQHDIKIELSEIYQLLSYKLKLFISITSESYKKIFQIHNAPNSKNQVIHFSNQANYETHVITNNNGINYIHMNANCALECRMQDVHVYIQENSKSDFITMDFSAIETWHKAHKMKFSLKVSNSSHHKLQIKLREKYKTFARIHINYKNSFSISNSCTNILVNVKILTQLCYDSMKRDFFLRPMPIKIDSNKSVVILSDQDVVQNMAIIIGKQKTKMKCQSFKNSLILTNSFNVQNYINRLTFIFIDYFASRRREMFNSLKLRFENFQNVEVENLLEDCHFLIEYI
uniref:Vacuolar protein sorting-associated protein 13 DH-like domain-containing protein n=1 Tax=Romanomermis culicivorax TaxID=13658 RepID=A0A915IFZ6_ROMCU